VELLDGSVSEELRWDRSIFFSCRVKTMDREYDAQSEEVKQLDALVQSMGLEDRDAYNKSAPSANSQRFGFALVTLEKGPVKRHVPAESSKAKADDTPKDNDGADALAAPLSIPRLASGSKANSAKTMCRDEAKLKIWVYIHTAGGYGVE
jgi:hypothetical protein